MTTCTKILVAVAALAVLVIALSRGGEPSAPLQELQDDPMASYVPPGGALLDGDSRGEGTSLGRPVQAQVTRLFRLSAGSRPAAAVDLHVALVDDARLLLEDVEPPALSVSLRRLAG